MGRTFNLFEPVDAQQGLGAPFLCAQPGSTPIDVFRMLNGTVDLVRKSDDRRVKCRYNYLTLRPSSAKTNDKKLSKTLFGEDVTVTEAKSILKKLGALYTGFFIQLSAEVQHCIFLYRTRHYVEAFLHFYRALEKLAVAFPVMYITAQSDFNKIHAMLKPLFTKEGGGELSFVDKFCKKLADDSDVLGEYKLTFNFDMPNDRYQILVQEVDAVLAGGKLAEVIEREEGAFQLPYRHVAPFVIECRNRLFHNNNTGFRNFDVDRLGGASELCRGLVETGLHWLALTYVEVIRNRAASVS